MHFLAKERTATFISLSCQVPIYAHTWSTWSAQADKGWCAWPWNLRDRPNDSHRRRPADSTVSSVCYQTDWTLLWIWTLHGRSQHSRCSGLRRQADDMTSAVSEPFPLSLSLSHSLSLQLALSFFCFCFIICYFFFIFYYFFLFFIIFFLILLFFLSSSIY